MLIIRLEKILNLILKEKKLESQLRNRKESNNNDVDYKTGKTSATNTIEQLDYNDYIEYSNAHNKYVKVKNGYGDYEYLKYSDVVNSDGSSKKPIERNVIGYPTLYSEGGQKAYGFNKTSYDERKKENKKVNDEIAQTKYFVDKKGEHVNYVETKDGKLMKTDGDKETLVAREVKREKSPKYQKA